MRNRPGQRDERQIDVFNSEFREPPPSQTNFIPTLSMGEYMSTLLCLSFKQRCHESRNQTEKPHKSRRARKYGTNCDLTAVKKFTSETADSDSAFSPHLTLFSWAWSISSPFFPSSSHVSCHCLIPGRCFHSSTVAFYRSVDLFAMMFLASPLNMLFNESFAQCSIINLYSVKSFIRHTCYDTSLISGDLINGSCDVLKRLMRKHAIQFEKVPKSQASFTLV